MPLLCCAGWTIGLINRDGEKMCTISKRTNSCYTLHCSSSLFKVKKMVSAPKSTERPIANCKEWLSQLPGIIVLYWSPACLACLFCLCWLLHHLVSVESQFFLFSNPLKNLPSSPFFIHHMQNSCVDIQTHAARVTYYTMRSEPLWLRFRYQSSGKEPDLDVQFWKWYKMFRGIILSRNNKLQNVIVFICLK